MLQYENDENKRRYVVARNDYKQMPRKKKNGESNLYQNRIITVMSFETSTKTLKNKKRNASAMHCIVKINKDTSGEDKVNRLAEYFNELLNQQEEVEAEEEFSVPRGMNA